MAADDGRDACGQSPDDRQELDTGMSEQTRTSPRTISLGRDNRGRHLFAKLDGGSLEMIARPVRPREVTVTILLTVDQLKLLMSECQT